MEIRQTTAEALARLEEPFASKEVKWLVAATSRDGRKGRVTPYADPRAYTDRLNHIFTASGWTREYSVHTVSPITRMKKDKPIQSGKSTGDLRRVDPRRRNAQRERRGVGRR